MAFVRSILLFFVLILIFCKGEKVKYLSMERPILEYYNKKYFTNFQVTSFRKSRNDPRHYVNMNYTMTTSLGNNLSIDFYLYESMSHSYRRSFIEMHFKMCDMLEKDQLIGAVFKKALQEQGQYQHCPYKPRTYTLVDMSFPVTLVPNSLLLSFTKGRLHANASMVGTKEPVASGYIDIEVKQYHTKKTTT